MCTGFLLQLADGTFLVARTMEFGLPSVWYRVSHLKPATHFLTWETKFPVLGVSYTFQPLWIMDGFNTNGIYCGAFLFPKFAHYSRRKCKQIQKDTSRNDLLRLPAEEVASWILGTVS